MKRTGLMALALLTGLPAWAQQVEIDAKGGDGAIGKIPCTPNHAIPLQDCHFGATRNDDGAITVRVILPGSGDTRVLTFKGGELVSSNATGAVSITQAGTWTIVTIEPEEHIELPTRALSGAGQN